MLTWIRSRRPVYRRIRGWVLTSIPLVLAVSMQCSGKGGGSGY